MLSKYSSRGKQLLELALKKTKRSEAQMCVSPVIPTAVSRSTLPLLVAATAIDPIADPNQAVGSCITSTDSESTKRYDLRFIVHHLY